MSNNIFKKNSKLLRDELGSIDLSDIQELKDEKLTDKEFLIRANSSETFYKNVFKKVLKLFIQKQLEFMGKEVKDYESFIFGRGTINGLILIDEWFQEQISIAHSQWKSKDEEPPEEVKNL